MKAPIESNGYTMHLINFRLTHLNGRRYRSNWSSFGQTTFERVVAHAIIIKHVVYNGAQDNELCKTV